MHDFLTMARKLNHDLIPLQAGDSVSSTLIVADVDQLRQLFHDDASPDIRQSRTAAMQSNAAATAGSAEALLQRVEAYVFADQPLAPEDRARLQAVFPMQVQAFSADTKTLQQGEVWDLGTSVSPVVINLNRLVMEPGSSLVIRNGVLSLNVSTLVCSGAVGAGGSPYHLAILGAKGPTPAAARNVGAVADAGAGEPGNCDGNRGGGTGQPGLPGLSGIDGDYGRDGLPALTASINIGAGGILSGDVRPGLFVIYTRSGDGGDGAAGGQGGQGGRGGRGGNGATCGCQGTWGGNGGVGGQGGRGGNGGQGGNGVDGNAISVLVPQGQASRVVVYREEAKPGQGGSGGQGGIGGEGGAGGTGGKHQPDGEKGPFGMSGEPGRPGMPGLRSGYAGNVIIREQ